MRIPLECYLILYGIKGCIVNILPLEDLPIDGPSNQKAQAMMHGDVGTGLDRLKELDPGPNTHDGMHVENIMEHGPSSIHYELVPPLPVTSKHVISAFQGGHQAFPLVKGKTSNRWQHLPPYLPFLQIIWRQNHLITWRE
jgi:hypothetical protein